MPLQEQVFVPQLNFEFAQDIFNDFQKYFGSLDKTMQTLYLASWIRIRRSVQVIDRQYSM